VTAADFERFDLIVAMDRSNERALRSLAPAGTDAAKIVLLGDFGPADAPSPEVVDPWGRPAAAYVAMFDRLEELCGALLDHVGPRRGR
jgi:low molecular weight protein-tyrosine phosphatase